MRNLKQLLTDAKDASELMVDLAYAAVFFDDDDLAREVIHLEDRMDDAVHEMRIVCMLASRSPDDAEGMAAILGMANSMEEIADAAEDIAPRRAQGPGCPQRAARRPAPRRGGHGRASSCATATSCRTAGWPMPTLPSETGMWIIVGVRRDVEFFYGPAGDFVLANGDVLILQGVARGRRPGPSAGRRRRVRTAPADRAGPSVEPGPRRRHPGRAQERRRGSRSAWRTPGDSVP